METKEECQQDRDIVPLHTLEGPNFTRETSRLATLPEENTGHGDGNEESHPDQSLLPITKIQFIMLNIALCVGIFIVTLDVIILVPTITHDFNSLDDVGWYGSAYLLTQTAFQPTFGKVYNYFNTKRTLLLGVLVFEIGSVLCAAATSSEMLISGRAVAGLGAAAIFSGGVNIITMIFPLRHRAPFLGLMGAMIGLAMIVAPPLGGVLTDRLSWRWCFWINLPCGGVMTIIIILSLKQTAQLSGNIKLRDRVRALDPLGAVVLISGITALLIGIQWGGHRYAWSNPKVWACMMSAAILLTLFCFLQLRRGERAIIPPRLLRQRSILGSSLSACFLSMAFHVHSYYMPIYFQAIKGLTAERSGIHVLPYQVTNTIFSIGTGILVGVVGWYPPFLWAGALAFVAGSVLFYRLEIDSSLGMIVGCQIIAGAGVGTAINIPHIAAQAVSSKQDVSSANALIFFFHAVGGAIGVAIGQNIFSSTLHRELPLIVPRLDASAIANDSSASIRTLIPAEDLAAVLGVYGVSVARTFISPIVSACLAFLFSLLLEWRSVKA